MTSNYIVTWLQHTLKTNLQLKYYSQDIHFYTVIEHGYILKI